MRHVANVKNYLINNLKNYLINKINFLIMKKVIISALFFVLLFATILTITSCKQDITDQVQENSLEQFSQQNVAFYDARIRSLNETSYVRELYFANFSDEKLSVQTTYFEGNVYFDNGLNNDLVANDGIFASNEVFKHDQRIPYDRINQVRSVLEKPVVHPDFKQNVKLAVLESSYELRKSQLQTRIFEVTCKVTFTGGGCRACDWWGGRHCDWCFSLSECTVTVGF